MYRDVLFFCDRLESEDTRRAKDNLTIAAFGAWLNGAGGKVGLNQFLNSLGLGEKKQPLAPEKRAAMIEKSNAIAERILNMARKKKKVNAKKNI